MESPVIPVISRTETGHRIGSQTYTGKLNICLDCAYYTTIDKGAEVHSRERKHFVFQDMVRKLPITTEAVEARRVFLKNEKRD